MVLSRYAYFYDIYARGQFDSNAFFIFACYMPHVDFLLGLFFNLEDRGDMLLRNGS
jgi:hypothetical protein